MSKKFVLAICFFLFHFYGCQSNSVEFIEDGKKPYIFDRSNITWCSVPVPAGVTLQSQTHPSIVYIPGKWRGYSHWLGTTPYPNADIKQENPCIYYANTKPDGTPPTAFKGIDKNPILAKDPEPSSFNSDDELYFENDTLYCIVRVCFNKKYAREIVVLKSTDGNTWSQPVHLYSNKDVSGPELLSPAILKKNGKYFIYHLNGDAGNSYTGKCTSLEIMEGSSLTKPDFKFLKKGSFVNKDSIHVEPWHIDLFEFENKLYMVFCGRKNSDPRLYTYLAVSSNYTDFVIYDKPLISVFNTYRPTAYVDKSNMFNLYFSVVGNYVGDGSDRAIGLARMNFIDLLKELAK